MRSDKNKIVSYFKIIDKKMAEIIAEIDFDEWFEIEKKDADKIFLCLCRNIIGQQLAGKAAESIFGRFKEFFKDRVTPQRILEYQEADLRQLGLSWAKAKSILDLAKKIKSGKLHLDNLEKMTDKEVIEELVQVRGIGKWTAEMFLIFSLGRENVFSLGDLGLKNGIKKYLGKKTVSEKEMENLVETWKPYKTYGAIAMWHLLDNKK